MQVLFFTKGGYEVGSSRMRAFNVARELEKNFSALGKFVVHAPPTHYRAIEILKIKRWQEFLLHAKIFARMKQDDVLFLQRAIYQAEFVCLVLWFHFLLRRRFIFDFDDSIFTHSPLSTYLLTRYANAVLVGSHHLYDYAAKKNPHTYLVPTSVDLQRFRWKEGVLPTRDLVIGWSGDGPAHVENLALLVPVFTKLARIRDDFIFYLLGAQGDQRIYSLFEIPHLKKKLVDYVHPDGVPDEIATFAIGLMPLEDNAFTRGKCSLKILEYFAMKKPAIASPVGENNFMIEKEKDGFLPATTNEWVAALSSLLDDAKLRHAMGAHGYAKVLNTYSLEAVARTIANVLARL